MTIHPVARSTTPRVGNWPCRSREFGASHGDRGAGCACGRAEDVLEKHTLALMRVYAKIYKCGTQFALVSFKSQL